MHSIAFNGKFLSLESPQIMTILNINDDSFYVSSRFKRIDEIEKFIEKSIEFGSKIVDLGAVSSRPYADEVSEKSELERLIPLFKPLRKRFPELFFSIDTEREEVARIAIEEGADMINDINSGLSSDAMLELIASKNMPYILMHRKGKPADMQDKPEYKNVCLEVLAFLAGRLKACKNAGASQLIIDPGFGFGKSIEHNYELLNKLEIFKILDVPILVGLSRKSMLTNLLGIETEAALNATTAVHMASLERGAKILRVHDPKEANEAIKLYLALKG